MRMTTRAAKRYYIHNPCDQFGKQYRISSLCEAQLTMPEACTIRSTIHTLIRLMPHGQIQNNSQFEANVSWVDRRTNRQFERCIFKCDILKTETDEIKNGFGDCRMKTMTSEPSSGQDGSSKTLRAAGVLRSLSIIIIIVYQNYSVSLHIVMFYFFSRPITDSAPCWRHWWVLWCSQCLVSTVNDPLVPRLLFPLSSANIVIISVCVCQIKLFLIPSFSSSLHLACDKIALRQVGTPLANCGRSIACLIADHTSQC